MKKHIALMALLAVAASLVSASPASAHDDFAEDESGPLWIEAVPSVIDVGDTAYVDAQFDGDVEWYRSFDDEDDEELSDDDEDEEVAGDVVELTSLTVDFGDGSAVEDMEITDEYDTYTDATSEHVYDVEGDFDVVVTAETEDGAVYEASVVVQVGGGSARLDGEDRIETALRISRESFADGSAGAVLLARTDGFADALSAATLALAEEAPVLLVPTGVLPVDVLAEIERVLGGTGTVYLLGGDAAISPAVADELAVRGHDVERIAGDDRVATSVAIGRFLVQAGAEIDEVVLASATTFPDALSGAAYAAERGAPVLLTAADELSPAVADFLDDLGTDVVVTVVGGTAGVSDGVVDDLEARGFDVDRIAGDDRYDTAVQIADAVDAPTTVVVATGTTYPDALAGGAYCGRLGAPLLLVGTGDVPDTVLDYLRAHADTIRIVVVLGGPGAVSESQMAEIEGALPL